MPAHKLHLWKQYDRHWQTLKQPSVGPKLSLYLRTTACWWRQVEGPTWQCSLTAYAYSHSATLRSTWADSCSWLFSQIYTAVCLACSLKINFPSNHTPNTSGMHRLIASTFRWKNRRIGMMGVWKHHWSRLRGCWAQSGWLDLMSRSLKSSVYLLLEHGNVILCCNYHGVTRVSLV